MRPAIGTIIFALLVPGTVIVIVPWRLSGWELAEPFFGWTGIRWIGLTLVIVGLPVVAQAMVRFVREGLGTPSPTFPTERLVVTGPYRYVRNPIYIGVLSMIVGQALIFGSRAVLVYALCVALAFHLFVVWYEEPTLRLRFGAEYDAYTRGVRRWRPRLAPWTLHR
ncbi:MAG: methyltransferase family protein [Armatimonadota bacterium]